MQTLQAGATVTLFPSATNTPLASNTSTSTLSPTPEFTSTAPAPVISVVVDTNCRLGPGTPFSIVGALLVGEFTEVYGKDPTGNYWYVSNPDVNGAFCWLWGEYAEIEGNVIAVPIFTPPPTPTPAPGYEANFASLQNCTTEWWANIDVTNNGSLAFRSLSFTLYDTNNKTTVFYSSDQFESANGCNPDVTKDSFASGGKVTISSPHLGYNPSGHKLRATITICSAEGVNGQCATKVITFTP